MRLRKELKHKYKWHIEVGRAVYELYLLRHEHEEAIRDLSFLRQMVLERIMVSRDSILRGEKKDPPGHEWDSRQWRKFARRHIWGGDSENLDWLKFRYSEWHDWKWMW